LHALYFQVHIWKEWEEKALINTMKEKGELFQQNKNHETIWNTISKGLKDNGISVSTQQVKNKWKNLKKTYKRIIDENKSTGNGRSQWKYLDEFNDMYGHKASTIPALVFDSGNSAGKRFSKQVKESNPENKNDKKEKETCREQRGKKRSSTVTVSDLLSKMEDQNENFTKIVKEQHEEKMNRFDRFLDLYESSLKKS
jgi:hydroxylamine reductase (hybrid-cluster protein)